jgi:MFS transporter, DHA1 family, inner membrane transport protein
LQPAPPTPPAPSRVLPVIVLAQLLGTSPWFAVNAVMPDLQRLAGWETHAVGGLSAALQLGFVAGTLLFALLAVADRFSARWVFFTSACGAAICTLAAAEASPSLPALTFWRVATGLCLAGIYPVGMKLAAQWFPQGLGAALGWLVGALVLGSASAHALRAWGVDFAQDGGSAVRSVFWAVAALCAVAGLMVLWLVPEPAVRLGRVAPGLRLQALASLWRDRRLRASAGGYFGHMWELYTVWVLVPLVLATRLADTVAVSWAAFLVLAAGALGCIGGGLVARRWGGPAAGARVAAVQLAASGLCCLVAPWMLQAPMPLFMVWLLLWGITVAGDSPQFSALTASFAPPAAVGSVLALVNSMGFAISAYSVDLFLRATAHHTLAVVLPWLALGPALGLWLLSPLLAGGASRR